jgi:DNA-directed RNA polymerase specialized sigma24 family protein
MSKLDLSSMKGQEALAIIDVLLQEKKLSDLQSAVFLEAWAEYSYSEIAQQLGYEYDYIKQVGSHLWRSLSQILGEPVSKRNIQSVLRRYQQTQLDH